MLHRSAIALGLLAWVLLACFVLAAPRVAAAQAPFITTWKTDNPGVSDPDQIRIPTLGSSPDFEYNFYVEWSEVGNPANSGSAGPFLGDATITFPAPGTYEVRILGDFPAIYFASGGDREKILSIDQWGDIAWGTMEHAFDGATHLTYAAQDQPDLRNVTSMALMFALAEAFDGDIGDWDVGNVTDMAGMFLGATSFNGAIGDWNVASVTNMTSMFLLATSFNRDLNNWDVSNVEYMRTMFLGAASFNGEIGDWDVSRVEDMAGMFASAVSFNGDISDWDVSNVWTMNGMFAGSQAFNRDISEWDVQNVKDMSRMFEGATAFDQDLSEWRVQNVEFMNGMFDGSGLSQGNYDATLRGWSQLSLQTDVQLGANDITYCEGAAARQKLIDDFNWEITGDSFSCTPAQYIVTVDDVTPRVGQSVTISAQLASAGGTPIPEAGRIVEWSVTGDGSLGVSSSTTDADGIATVTFTVSTTASTEHVVTATDGDDASITGTSPTITAQVGAPSKYLVTVSDETPVVGTDVTVTAQLLDEHGNAVAEAGRTVNWSATGGGSLSAPSSTTDTDGIATVKFTVSTTASTEHVVTATDGDDASITGTSPTITAQVGAPTQYLVEVSDETPIVGTDVTVIAQLVDPYGNRVAAEGHTVNWSSTGGGTFSHPSTPTDTDGLASVTFTVSNIVGTEHVVTATDAADASITGASPKIMVESPIYLGVDGTLLYGTQLTRAADGEMASTLAVQLKDWDGNNLPLAGVEVRFATTLGELSPSSIAFTDADGVARMSLSSTDAGVADVTAEVNVGGGNWYPVVHGSPVRVSFLPMDNQLAITQSVQPTYAGFGEPIHLDITVTNVSNSVQTEIEIVDHLPDHFTPDMAASAQLFVGLSGQGMGAATLPPVGIYDGAAGTITWTIDALGPGESVTVSFRGSVDHVPEGTELQNYVVATAQGVVGYAHNLLSIFIGNWPAMQVSQSAETDSVEIGDTVRYSIEIENRADVTTPVDSSESFIVAQLPRGFVYLEGSSRIDGVPTSDPDWDGRTLLWRIGGVPAGTAIRLEYVAAVSTAATGSSGVSMAYAGGLSEAGFPYVTEAVETRVTVSPGLFGIDGLIVGTVFLDFNGNGLQDSGEPGIRGARIVTDEGVEIVTDEHGLYSLRGVQPGAHALRLFVPGTDGDQGMTEFVRVPVGGITTLDFAVVPAGATAGLGSLMGTEDRVSTETAGSLSHHRETRVVGSHDVTVGLLDVRLPLDAGGRSGSQIQGAFYTQRTLESGSVVTVRYTSRLSLTEGVAAFPAGSVMGDSSWTRDLAPSQEALYLKLETEIGTLFYGDFVAPTRENRFVPHAGRLTGWLATTGSDVWQLTGFVSPHRGVEASTEVSADGVSGPYVLDHQGLIAGSESVWLLRVRVDDAVEVSRTQLLHTVDYTLDVETGTLWLSRPLPSFNSDGTRNVIAVQYVIADEALGGARSGLRLSTTPGAPLPFGITWLTGATEGSERSTLGIDGTLPLGESTLTYELATQTGEGEAGTAAHLEWHASPEERFRLSASLHSVNGAVRRLTGGLLREGLTAEGRLELPIGDGRSLIYGRSYHRNANALERHEDTLTLQIERSNFRHQMELRSTGEGILPGAGRTSTLHLGTEWTISERQSLGLTGRVSLDGSGETLLPATADYRLAFSESAHLGLAYTARRSPSSGPEWSLSLGNHPQGRPALYGRYRRVGGTGAQDELLVGLKHAWRVTPDLQLSLNAEQGIAMGGSGSPKRTLSWSVGYSGLDGHELALKHEVTASAQGKSQAVTASVGGELRAGWEYDLHARWHTPSSLSARERLVREIRGTLVVRDLERGRNTLIVQALDRLTLRLNAEGEEDSRQVSLFAVDWTHQLENGVTLSTKVALRQRLREWQMSGGDEASYGMQALLYQLSANVPVAERAAVEVFGRQIVDSAGGSVGGGAVELLYDLTPDVAIGLGVSNFGGTDPDFAHLVPPWSEGVYMRLQVKY